MSKLKLRVDELAVESFTPGPDLSHDVGTVKARETADTVDYTACFTNCLTFCLGSCETQCDTACVPSQCATHCPQTCPQTCPFPCGPVTSLC